MSDYAPMKAVLVDRPFNDPKVGGRTAPKGSRRRLGALPVGHWEDSKLRYAGKIGTGFDAATLNLLGDELERELVREEPAA